MDICPPGVKEELNSSKYYCSKREAAGPSGSEQSVMITSFCPVLREELQSVSDAHGHAWVGEQSRHVREVLLGDSYDDLRGSKNSKGSGSEAQ